MHLIKTFAIIALGVMISAVPARALTLLRDADIEHALSQLAKPILTAAGLSPSRVKILVIKDSQLNAFVVDTQHIFLHSGLILKLNSAPALQAVIAHEAAHISNGHISRRISNQRFSQNAAGIGMALAGVAALSGGGQAAIGAAVGVQSSAHRMFLAHTRAEEAAADQSSVRYMLRAGIDPQGAVDVQKIFKGQEALATSRQDPYARSHPLSRDRLRALEGLVASQSKSFPDNPTSEYWYARARGKLSAFLRAPNWTLRRADESPSKDISLMRKAAAYHQKSDLSKALKAINGAIALRPKDGFLHDLKGQILLESRKTKDAVAVYSKAAKLTRNNPLILGGYGRALLAAGQINKALPVLEKARSKDGSDLRILRDLAVAYAKKGQNGLASLVTAERYALRGRLPDAAIHAKRASGLLPQGSAPWRRAQDVLHASQQAAKRR